MQALTDLLPLVESQEQLDDCIAERSHEDTNLGVELVAQPVNGEDVTLRRAKGGVHILYNQMGQLTY